jgi:UDP-glucose 4-epimerase
VSLQRVEELTGRSVEFQEADLRDRQALRRVFEAVQERGDRIGQLTSHRLLLFIAIIECVIHFAALKSVAESCSQPLKYYGNNVTGSANLLEVMMEFGVQRIVFSSSATVYGQPQYLPVDESHPTGHCVNPYGKTKFFMEEIIRDVSAANPEWSCTLLRYFNPVGAHSSGRCHFAVSCINLHHAARIGEDPLEEPNNLMPYVAQVRWSPRSLRPAGSQVAMGRREMLSVFGSDWETTDGTGECGRLDDHRQAAGTTST